MAAFKYERLVGLCYACGHLGHEKKNCTLHEPSPEQQPNPYGEWMKAGARRRRDPADNKTTSPPHRRDDSASQPTPTRQSAQCRGSAVDLATVTSQVTSPTLEPVYPLEKVNLKEKQDFLENMITKKYEIPTKSMSMTPAPIPTIPQLCMKPLTTRQVSEHHTDPLPITEASTDMHGGEGSMSGEHAGHVCTTPQFLKNHATHVEGSIISEHASHVVTKPHSQIKQTTWTRLARGPYRDGMEHESEGFKWKVGSGALINIFGHQWLPRPRFLCRDGPGPMKVRELVDLETGQWDRAKLAYWFEPHTCADILSIPMPNMQANDTPV